MMGAKFSRDNAIMMSRISSTMEKEIMMMKFIIRRNIGTGSDNMRYSNMSK